MAINDILKTVPDAKSFGAVQPLPTIDAEEVFKAIESRRSVRVFTEEQIPESVMRRCLKAATLAPNSSNMQPWEMHWVRSADKKSQLIEACLGQPTAKNAAELVVFVARTRTWPQMRKRMLAHFSTQTNVPQSALDYYQKLIPLALEQGPLGLIGLGKKIVLFLRGLTKPTPRGPTSQNEMLIWANKTVALACENYMIAMRASGFDTCPMEGFDAVRVAKLLNLPSDASVVMVISAGKRAPNGVYGPQIRFEDSLFIKEH
jgi:nitroreductase